MKTAKVTYVAPFGDNKVAEMGGVTFFDGIATDINSYDHPHLIEKLQDNQHFDIEVSEDKPDESKPKRKPGRPSNADLAAAKAEAEETERLAKIATDKAADAKKNADAAKAASVKPALTPADQQAAQLGNQSTQGPAVNAIMPIT